MSPTIDDDLSGPAALALQWLENSPFVGLVGVRVDTYQKDLVRLSLPFREELATMGDVIHGGAIASLIDTAAAGVAWSGAEEVSSMKGTTVSINVSFLAAARAVEVTAEARVLRRGKSLCFCEIDVTTPEGELVAKGAVTYKLG